ncbi:MAG: hypothetical protein IT239_05055, partial [Bacteroidia bacterium]|nr:hypothetical protein [Bacteroidia bacterium]
EMTLHGDPAIVLNSFRKPDFVITSNNIYTKPNYIDATVDSFEIKTVVNNIGMAYPNSVQIEYKRTLPNQSVQTFLTQMPRSYYSDTVSLKFATQAFTAGGVNKFCVNADPGNLIDELDNFVNNKACYDVNVNSDDIFPIYPYHYSVIPDKQTKLIASTSNPNAPLRTYRFQIDTTDLFNSPFLKEASFSQTGGLIEWNLPFICADSTVYFWRVANDNGSGNLQWKEFSFQYIPQKSGWGQSHFFQYKENKFQFLDYNRTQRKLNYVNSTVRIECATFGNSVSYGTGYKIDGVTKDYAGCGWTPQIHIAIIDTLTFTPWTTDRNNYGNNNAFINGQSNCSVRITPDRLFAFAPGNPTQLHALKEFLDTAVPNGYYILLFTYVHGDFSKWDNATLTYLNSLGSTVNSFMGNVPYIFFCKKGDLASAKEVFGASPTDAISFTQDVNKNWYYGSMNSVLIGPSLKWNSFHWRTKALEQANNDEVKARLYGLKNITDPVPALLAEFPPDSLDVLDLAHYANASVYPYLNLTFYTKDGVTFTPRQLRYWRILHDDVPEAAVAPSIKLSLNNTDFNAGEELKLTVAVKNISDFNMDSLKINYWLIDRFNQRIDIPYLQQAPLAKVRQKPLLKHDTLYSSITLPTLPYQGTNQLWMEINPNNDQVEKYHFNNFLNIRFGVNPDKQNPLLDVTFDGVRIMDGDLVSAKPDVVITLKDENKYLALNDTSLFKVSLLEPGQTIKKPLYFKGGNDYSMNFTPASLPTNRAKINYIPEFKKDGTYQLIVQGQDVSGNRSAGLEYKVNFEVITKSSITQILNYPNPFSTKTHFVFTLTGSKIPTYFKIQILTITGKVVREIDLAELGPIHIGRNITDYAWDGTDMFGDRLANGLYFYKVITNIDGNEIELRQTQADQYFKKGFGKMYLMR